MYVKGGGRIQQGKGGGKIHPTFRWWAANLLAFTKFVGIGLLIK